MARLPQPGGDAGNWGEILNDYLAQSHDATGRLKNTGVLASKYTKPTNGIPATDLEEGVKDVLDTIPEHTTTLAEHDTDIAAVTTRIDGSLKPDGTLKDASVPRAALGAEVAADIAASAGVIISVRQRSVNVQDYGIVADNATDQRAALQTLIDAVGGDTPILFPTTPLPYVLSDSLVIKRVGQILAGQNEMKTTLKMLTDKPAIKVAKDPTHTNPNVNLFPTIRDLNLVGPGVGSSTNPGILVQDNLGTYNGDFLLIDNVKITGFDKGIFLDHWAQSQIRRYFIQQCRVGIHAAGNVNTIDVGNGGISQCTETGILLTGGGYGIRLFLGDIGDTPRFIELELGISATMEGGNFESCSGTEAFIYVPTSAKLTAIGARFLKGHGNDVPPFRVGANASLTLVNPTMNGFTTSALVKKDATGSVVQVINPDSTLNTSVRIDDGGTKFPPSIFPSRMDNSVPSATDNYRGQTVAVMARDVSAVEDRLVHTIRNRVAGTFEVVDLTNPRRFWSSDGGTTAHARVDGATTFEGRKDVTTAAASSTDVTVNVGAFALLYSVRATVELVDATARQMYAVLKTKTAATGDVVFTVWHTADTAGGVSIRLNYEINVQR